MLKIYSSGRLCGRSQLSLIFSNQARSFYQSILGYREHFLIDDFLGSGHNFRSQKLAQIPKSIFILLSVGQKLNGAMDHQTSKLSNKQKIRLILQTNKIINSNLTQPNMSKFSTIDADSIRKHPANNSPSKLAYQFSKSKRFPDINPECPNAFYTFDSQLSHRKTGFGYGKKYDFTQVTTVSPPSTKYSSKSFVDDAKKHGLTFGLSRQASPDRSYLIPQLQKNPGPGKYESDKLKQKNLSFTMRPRTLDVFEKHNTAKHTPSPVAYNTVDMQPKNGRFFCAKFSDAKLSAMNMKSDRFDKIKETPGPSSYFQKDGLIGNAKYVLSNHKGNGTRAFNQTARFTREKWTNLQNPGPGNYALTSDFGVYGDAKYYKTLSNFNKGE